MGALNTRERHTASDFEYADDPRAYRAGREAREGQRIVAERLTALLIAAVGGPFVQRRPTRAECRTSELDCFAEKVRAGFRGLRSRMVAVRLEQLGLTLGQVEAWAKETP